MNPFSSRRLITILAISLAVPANAQQAPGTLPADIVVNMRNVDITDVAQQISRITGRTIILDPSVKGTVNVTSATPLTSVRVWELFLSVLRGQGYSAVRNGRAWRIVPQATAVREPPASATSGRLVTRLVRLHTLSPEAAARIFRPLVASFGSVEPVTSPSGIVVTDYADNVARIEALARSLDGSGSGAGFDTIDLRYAKAKDVATAINGILGEGEAAGPPRAVADERSNMVLVRGGAQVILEARKLVRMLDRPGGTTPVTRVFRLRNSDAESVTAVLRGLMGSGEQVNNPVARTLRAPGRSPAGSGSPAGAGTAGASGLPAPVDPTATRTASEVSAPKVNGASGASGFSTEDLAVEPAPELNAIVVRGTPTAIAAIEPLITELDVRRPQVLIEAAIVEITGDRSEQLGIQLGLGGAADGVNNSGGTSFSNLGLSLSQVLTAIGAPAATAMTTDGLSANVGRRGDFGILIQALGQSTRANLLSTPSVTTLDNQPAEIVVGQNVPFRTGSFTTSGNTLTPFTTIERADVGITLRVVPRVHEGDTVRLEVNQEVSSLTNAVAGAADIVTNRRSIQTTVLADDGQTIVLGGLISDDQVRTKSQVPVLGDIPVVGNLFKSRTESKTRRTLFVFLRPTILRDSKSVAAAAAARYSRLRTAESGLKDEPSLLLEPPQARLPSEIEGIY